MRPHDIGFDEFYGYYAAQKEITQHVYKARYPDLVLNPERLAMLEKTGGSEALVHGFKGGETTDVEQVDSVEDMAEGDQMLKEFSVKKIKELAAGDAPFFLEHSFMKVHADNFASKEFEGKSASKYPYKDAVVEVDAYHWRHSEGLGRGWRARKHVHFRHLRQWPAARCMAGRRLHAVPRRQGLGMGRRRARPRHRLLEGHDRARPRERRSLRPDGSLQHLAQPRGCNRQDPDRPLHRRHRPDFVPARRRRQVEPREDLHLE